MSTLRLHTCNTHCTPDCAAHRRVADRQRSQPAIDVHCHAFVPEVEALVMDHPLRLAEKHVFEASTGAVSVAHNQQYMLPQASARMASPERRLADMQAMGIDVQVISPSPSQYHNWAPAELAEQLVQLQNEGIAELCAQQPAQFMGLGTVSLQHPFLAVTQLEQAVKRYGLKGVQVSTSIQGRELADPAFDRFWARAESLGCVVFIHPFGTTLGTRLDKYYLSNLVGQPLETTIALSMLIFGGVLDRYPKLKLLAAHGGGYLPYYMGRSNHGYQVRPEAGTCLRPPGEYLRQIWFDSLVYQPEALRTLIASVGTSQIVVGSDYPFDMGAYDIHHMLDGLSELSDEQRADILAGNAMRLLGLEPALMTTNTGWFPQ